MNVIRFPPPEQPVPPAEPFLNIPPATRIFVAAFLLVHGALVFWAPASLHNAIIVRFSFIPAQYTGFLPFAPEALIAPLAYNFLHGSWAHVLLNSAMMAAFGSGMERALGAPRMILLFFVSSLCAALTHLALYPGSTTPVIGASGGVNGLFAGALLMFFAQGRQDEAARRSFAVLVLVWVVVSVVFGLMEAPGGGTVAWAAHIGGFLGGLVLFKAITGQKNRGNIRKP